MTTQTGTLNCTDVLHRVNGTFVRKISSKIVRPIQGSPFLLSQQHGRAKSCLFQSQQSFNSIQYFHHLMLAIIRRNSVYSVSAQSLLTKSLSPSQLQGLCNMACLPAPKHRSSSTLHIHPDCLQLHTCQSVIILWRQTRDVTVILTTLDE